MDKYNGHSLESAMSPLVGPDAMVIQAVAVVVCMDNEGNKWLSNFRSTDLRTWEARGMVEELRDTLTAAQIYEALAPDEPTD